MSAGDECGGLGCGEDVAAVGVGVLGGVGRARVAQVGDGGLGRREPGEVVAAVGGDVVLGDVAVRLLDELLNVVGVEPLLGGDLLGGVVQVDPARAEGGAGAFSLVPGDRGVQPPRGAGVIRGVQVGDLLVRGVRRGASLRSGGVQLHARPPPGRS